MRSVTSDQCKSTKECRWSVYAPTGTQKEGTNDKVIEGSLGEGTEMTATNSGEANFKEIVSSYIFDASSSP
ncbi:unnamed protein product [Albugo candida]|uniref:Uncharacterized protein n=1 Tax=Albugo candida TaxID=65357 RepID=A0A024FW15_9STRA|nr:unnamed protein product [Albugo candida]|eukprot:CCI11353.1 unnamed protein product [Albugo candida]